MPFVPNTDADRALMLEAIGAKTFDDLVANIPEPIRLKGLLNLPKQLSEMEALSELSALAAMNQNTEEYLSFLGGGAYDHFVPAAVGAVASRSEFYTSYTPYQAEVGQGTLQAIYEYQTMICRLTEMDVANASMYDGATALAEAMLLAVAHTNKTDVVLAGKINPNYVAVLKTYAHGQGITIHHTELEDGTANMDSLKSLVGENTAAVMVQQPNFYGCLEDVQAIEQLAHAAKALYVVSVDPMSLGLLEAPGKYGADIVVGEGQVFGNAQNFGGPYVGIFAVKNALLRKIPGRLSGMTIDKAGETGFILTLQTREQHIRREKATSNICTNQALNALCSCLYLSLMGKEGLAEVSNLCLQKAHYLAGEIAKVKGFKLKFQKPFFKEFAIETPKPAAEILKKLEAEKIHAGIDLGAFGDNGLLIAVTEKKTKEQLDMFVAALKSL
ncbi:MAG: aminomethyl-transferring glycine dehydrogenase subunit GcvPA [Rhizobacter sp.]|nr:aminomethyl-transferring glycine dehydrogenase subunit GcvPA [Chlorobiales bacterium]